jgi:hypothetical protein
MLLAENAYINLWININMRSAIITIGTYTALVFLFLVMYMGFKLYGGSNGNHPTEHFMSPQAPMMPQMGGPQMMIQPPMMMPQMPQMPPMAGMMPNMPNMMPMGGSMTPMGGMGGMGMMMPPTMMMPPGAGKGKQSSSSSSSSKKKKKRRSR